MKLQLFLLLAFFLAIISCNTKLNASSIIKQGNDWVLDNHDIQEMMNFKKAKEIEKEVLAKVEEIQNENSNSDKQVLQPDSQNLMATTIDALGNETLKFLKRFKLDNTMEYVKVSLVPAIKERLKLTALLDNYFPKNELEAKIVEKVREYSPCRVYGSWPTERDNIDYNYFHEGYRKFKLHEYKIGPLADGKYIYVKIFEENGVVVVVCISDKEKEAINTIFVYTIDYKYPPSPNKDRKVNSNINK